jgi:hypothetical protein
MYCSIGSGFTAPGLGVVDDVVGFGDVLPDEVSVAVDDCTAAT